MGDNLLSGDWASFPEVEHLTNVDDTRDNKGNGPSYLQRALVDIDGDGAVELINIAADVCGKDYWRIYSRSGPATPQGCMSALHSETGMDLGLRYRVNATIAAVPCHFQSGIFNHFTARIWLQMFHSHRNTHPVGVITTRREENSAALKAFP